MSQSENPTQSHRLCVVGLVSVQRANVSNKTHRLSNQVWAVVGLSDSTTENPVHQNAACVSPKNFGILK